MMSVLLLIVVQILRATILLRSLGRKSALSTRALRMVLLHFASSRLGPRRQEPIRVISSHLRRLLIIHRGSTTTGKALFVVGLNDKVVLNCAEIQHCLFLYHLLGRGHILLMHCLAVTGLQIS
jgi:hypothetical protein